ncbi:SDR family NAD(P)-dependent oxidoreductase [Gammaproteobacteria bacterium]|nr:SDR family NAD(P)-dependent oxidoreductase [Gammaproteobacteria bacterium]
MEVEASTTEAFTGKVVWITGASSGIGEGMAKAFAAAGAKVVLSARNQIALNRVKDESIAQGADEENLFVLPLDVVEFSAMPDAVAAVLERFKRIDLLINNAGQGARDLCLDMEFEIYRRAMDVNLFAAIALTKAVLPTMVSQGSGRVAGVSSMAGKIGVPLRTAYCPAKHAVLGFFDALRAEMAHHGIKVSTIVPGVVRTNAVAGAMKGNGELIGAEEGVMEGGLSVDEAIAIIMPQLTEGVDEIVVAVEGEVQMMKMKREDPVAVFRALEAMAEQDIYANS